MGSGVGVVLFLRRRRVSCQRPGLVGGRGGGGERINRDELILQRTEISRHLPSKFALSLIFFFFSFFHPTCLHPSPHTLFVALNCFSLKHNGLLSQAGVKPGVWIEAGNCLFTLSEKYFSL